MEYNSATMSSSDKEIKAKTNPYNTRSKSMKSSDKKNNKLAHSTLLPPSSLVPKKCKKETRF